MKYRCVYADKDMAADPAAVENCPVTDMNIIADKYSERIR
jgi:hypothetical protein